MLEKLLSNILHDEGERKLCKEILLDSIEVSEGYEINLTARSHSRQSTTTALALLLRNHFEEAAWRLASSECMYRYRYRSDKCRLPALESLGIL